MPDKDYYLEFARRTHPGSYVSLEECFICGFLRYIGWDPSKPEGYSIEETTSPADCPICSEVLRRFPEIFQWVLTVVAKSHGGKRP